jgi:hypothetical protein
MERAKGQREAALMSKIPQSSQRFGRKSCDSLLIIIAQSTALMFLKSNCSRHAQNVVSVGIRSHLTSSPPWRSTVASPVNPTMLACPTTVTQTGVVLQGTTVENLASELGVWALVTRTLRRRVRVRLLGWALLPFVPVILSIASPSPWTIHLRPIVSSSGSFFVIHATTPQLGTHGSAQWL